MPEKNNQTQLYNDLDEVLNQPPKKMVRYGNVLLLLVIIMVCCISFIVKHEDVIECRATVLPQHFLLLQSPQASATVKKFFLRKDTLLHEGDTILILNTLNGTGEKQVAAATETVMLAPFDCKVSLKRIPEQGEVLNPATTVAAITGAQNKFDVKLEIPEAEAAQVRLGLRVTFSSGYFPVKEYGEAVCTVVSLPVTDSVSGKTVVDARLVFGKEHKEKPGMYYVFKKTGTANIICGRKSLAGAFIEFQ